MRGTMKRVVVAMALGLASVCGAAWAQQSGSGLGQSWPNAPDVSSSPRYHVYVFEKDGIRFVQVNESNGTVRGAFAVAGGQFLRLPIGVDSGHSAAPQQLPAAPAQGETVYQDDAVKVQAAPQSNGRSALSAQEVCGDPAICGGGRINM